MKQYIDLLQHIITNGEDRKDRTGVGTRSVFGYQMRFDLEKGFPAVTTKKLAWKAMLSELLWFIEGSSDERRLCEILYGTRSPEKTTIWTSNANADYWKSNAKFDGDCGRIYGKQWREFRGGVKIAQPILSQRPEEYIDDYVENQYHYIDQIKQLVDGIKKDPFGRRHIISAWNPSEINQMALPPCHVLSQFYVSNNNKLSCQLYTRSQDVPLGTPFNIASYAVLTHMIAQVCGLKVGHYVHTIGDAHIYLNQIDGVIEQLKRDPMPLPTLWLNPEVTDIDSFTMDDVKLIDYNHHSPIKFEFAT